MSGPVWNNSLETHWLRQQGEEAPHCDLLDENGHSPRWGKEMSAEDAAWLDAKLKSQESLDVEVMPRDEDPEDNTVYYGW